MSTTRRGATRQKLYEAAVTLIAEQGFSATTVDEIAERAKVAKGTVYYNFASKTELFEGLLRHGMDLLIDSLREAATGLPPLEALDAMVRAGLEFIAAYPSFAQLFIAETWRTNRAWHEALHTLRDNAVAVVSEVLDEAIRQGALTADLDTELTAAALYGMVLVVALDWLVFQPERSLDDVHAALVRLVHGRITG